MADDKAVAEVANGLEKTTLKVEGEGGGEAVAPGKKKNPHTSSSSSLLPDMEHIDPHNRPDKLNPHVKNAKKSPKVGKKKKGGGGGSKAAEREPPEYIAHRLAIFEELWAKQEAEIAAKEPQPIKVTLPDGKVVEGQSWRTTPMDVAKGISEGFARELVVAKVNNVLWDLERVLEEDTKLQLLKFDCDDGRNVFWHSSAHVLGQCMELHKGGCLCYGPPIADGFYYDSYMGEETFLDEDKKPLEQLATKCIKAKQKFQRLRIHKNDLLRMFEYNKFKHRIIKERIETEYTTVYRNGPLIDLCRGPHIPTTSKIKAFKVVRNASSYWEGNADAEVLRRVYGISFPSKDQMKEWEIMMAEAAKRDHRKIGRDQGLFFFHELSPGSCFFTPRGTRIYKALMSFIRECYIERGFDEVVTPNMFNSKLWETSGHWQHYADDMFQVPVKDSEGDVHEVYALKPMNCPSHCLMFKQGSRSYKELPLRFADFGVLHRNELAGALTGLTRVRRFQQDDAHIFCMPSQIEEEIEGAIKFLEAVYDVFGFTFELHLSTRPEKYLGEIKTWDFAEKSLSNALDKSGHKWSLNPGDGAFYGPKIDIKIRDAIKRQHQCATIQLDFQLPIRFDLTYVPSEREEGKTYRPVIIHRAILGSVERMFAILCENYAGKWPFWLSPRQAQVVAVHPKFEAYAQQVQRRFHLLDFAIDVDRDEGSTMLKKIRNACVAQYNFILVVGESEEANKTANVRTRDGAQHGEYSLDDIEAHFRRLRADRLDDDTPPGSTAAATAAAEAEKAAARAAEKKARDDARAAEKKAKKDAERAAIAVKRKAAAEAKQAANLAAKQAAAAEELAKDE
eukprot:UC1_evm1s957